MENIRVRKSQQLIGLSVHLEFFTVKNPIILEKS